MPDVNRQKIKLLKLAELLWRETDYGRNDNYRTLRADRHRRYGDEFNGGFFFRGCVGARRMIKYGYGYYRADALIK